MSTASSLLATLSSDLTRLVDAIGPHIVSVAGRARRPASGLAIGGDLFITADHAIEHDQVIAIVVDGARHEAALVGRDPATDLALIRAPGLTIPAPATAPPPGAGAL